MFNNFLSFTFLLILYLTSSTNGLNAPLIPPLSPKSPFYTQILEANNISTTTAAATTTDITLNQDHYMKWLLTKLSMSPNDESEIHYLRKAGGYVMSMYIGNPYQEMYGTFDTGSPIVWVPCKERLRRRYMFPVYNQTESSTYKTISCGDKELCDSNKERSIKGCYQDPKICTFKIGYGDGSSANGVMATDRITFKMSGWKVLLNFKLGCSWDNSVQLPGIIGASNNDYSLPKQLNPTDPKFSYCISDDLTKTHVISFGNDAKLLGNPLPLKTNPYNNLHFIDVYGFRVNMEVVPVPPSLFKMSFDGRRGLIIDSGTTMTHLTSEAFDALKTKIEHFLGSPPKKFMKFEVCYPSSTFGSVWPWKKRPILGLEYAPNFVFEFDDKRAWQKMANSGGLECLLVLRTESLVSILGMQTLLNLNIGYDPKNGHLHIHKTVCPTA